MQLPKQCRPVQRSAASSPCGHDREKGIEAAMVCGVQPNGAGINPNFDWGGLAGSLIQTALPAVLSAI